MQMKKKELEDNIAQCEKKLIRAEALIGGLGGEKDRWTESAKVLGELFIKLTGDVLVAGTVQAATHPLLGRVLAEQHSRRRGQDPRLEDRRPARGRLQHRQRHRGEQLAPLAALHRPPGPG